MTWESDDDALLAERYREDGEAADDRPAQLASVPAATGFRYLRPLAQFLGDDEPEDDGSEWLVRGLVAAGVPNIIAGDPKAKKSFLMWHVAICVAAGIPVLGQEQFAARRGRVLVLEREDSVRECRRRVWRMARGLGLDPRTLDGWLFVEREESFYFDDVDHVAKLKGELRLKKDAGAAVDLVYVDSLRAAHRADENDSTAMAPILGVWNDLCAEFGCALSTVHHAKKMVVEGETDPGKMLRGSSAIHAMVRHFLFVATNHKTKISTVSTGGNMGGSPEPFSYAFDDGFDANGKPTVALRWTGDPEQAGASVAEQKILAALYDEPDGLNDGQLYAKVGGAKVAFDTAKRKMQKNVGAAEAVIYRTRIGAPWLLRVDLRKAAP